MHLYKILACFFVTYELPLPHMQGLDTWSCTFQIFVLTMTMCFTVVMKFP